MEWNKDLSAIPEGEDVLVKIKYKPVPYYMYSVVERYSHIGKEDKYILSDSDNEETIDHDFFVEWLYLDPTIEEPVCN